MPSITNPANTQASAAATAPEPAAKPKHEEPDRALYNEAKARRTPLTFHLRSGRQITGLVVAFGMFTVRVETSAGPVLLYKHALDLVKISGASTPKNARPGPPSSTAAPGPLRPPVANSR